jgi:hypothetical protein
MVHCQPMARQMTVSVVGPLDHPFAWLDPLTALPLVPVAIDPLLPTSLVTPNPFHHPEPDLVLPLLPYHWA